MGGMSQKEVGLGEQDAATAVLVNALCRGVQRCVVHGEIRLVDVRINTVTGRLGEVK